MEVTTSDDPWLTMAVLSALANSILLVGLPFLVFAVYHRLRWKRPFVEAARRAGLQVGEARYVAYSLGVAAVCVTALLVWPPDLEAMTREGSAQRQFAGLGLGLRAVVEALIYGFVKTGFAEEFLFRGLIAGSLGRHLRLAWANLVQASIFLVPHPGAVVGDAGVVALPDRRLRWRARHRVAPDQIGVDFRALADPRPGERRHEPRGRLSLHAPIVNAGPSAQSGVAHVLNALETLNRARAARARGPNGERRLGSNRTLPEVDTPGRAAGFAKATFGGRLQAVRVARRRCRLRPCDQSGSIQNDRCRAMSC